MESILVGLAGVHPSRLPVCPSDLDRPGIQVEVEGVRLGEHSLPPSVQGVEIKERIPEKELPEFERLLTPFVPEHLPVDPRPGRLLKAFKRIPPTLDNKTRYNTYGVCSR